MPDYQTMYLHLFNCVTDALTAMEAFNFGDAKEILRRAQQETEELYMREEENIPQK